MTGLRERKKQRTREAIVDAALELFAERGYEQTTIADIADAADVSARTVFSYFPSKEDILFSDLGQLQAQLAQMLADRAEGVTTLDVLRDFIYATLEHKLDEKAMRRKHVLACDEGLRNSQRGRLGAFEEMIVEGLARDLDAGPGDIRPRIAAASLMAAFTALQESAAPNPEPISREDAKATLDEVLDFLRAGLEALRRSGS